MKEGKGFLKPSTFPFMESDRREGDLRAPSQDDLNKVLYPDGSRLHSPREDGRSNVDLWQGRFEDGNGFN